MTKRSKHPLFARGQHRGVIDIIIAYARPIIPLFAPIPFYSIGSATQFNVDLPWRFRSKSLIRVEIPSGLVFRCPEMGSDDPASGVDCIVVQPPAPLLDLSAESKWVVGVIVPVILDPGTQSDLKRGIYGHP